MNLERTVNVFEILLEELRLLTALDVSQVTPAFDPAASDFLVFKPNNKVSKLCLIFAVEALRVIEGHELVSEHDPPPNCTRCFGFYIMCSRPPRST